MTDLAVVERTVECVATFVVKQRDYPVPPSGIAVLLL
jgi:hypothetical protein